MQVLHEAARTRKIRPTLGTRYLTWSNNKANIVVTKPKQLWLQNTVITFLAFFFQNYIGNYSTCPSVLITLVLKTDCTPGIAIFTKGFGAPFSYRLVRLLALCTFTIRVCGSRYLIEISKSPDIFKSVCKVQITRNEYTTLQTIVNRKKRQKVGIYHEQFSRKIRS